MLVNQGRFRKRLAGDIKCVAAIRSLFMCVSFSDLFKRCLHGFVTFREVRLHLAVSSCDTPVRDVGSE